jgi:hypothetical protein
VQGEFLWFFLIWIRIILPKEIQSSKIPCWESHLTTRKNSTQEMWEHYSGQEVLLHFACSSEGSLSNHREARST